MIDAVLVEAEPAAHVPAPLGEGYGALAGWDPLTDAGNYVHQVFEPTRVQVWQEGEDLVGRTLMGNGEC